MSCTNNSLRSINASDLTSMKYYDYTIDYITEPNGKRMYLVSKIIDQYNKKHNTKKMYKNYLKTEGTREFIDILASEEEGEDNPVLDNQQNDNINHKSYEKYKNLQGINQMVTIKGQNETYTAKAYLVSEPLLNDCLMSIDRKLAREIIGFIIKCRELDNEYLKKKLIGLQLENKTLKETNEMLSNRYIKDKHQNNWKLSIVPAFDKTTGEFEIQLVYKKTDSTSLSFNALLSVIGIPNANVMRSTMFPKLLELLESFQGKRKNRQRSRVTMPLNNYAEHCPTVITEEMMNCPVELIPIKQDLLYKIKELIYSIINNLNWQNCFIVCYE